MRLTLISCIFFLLYAVSLSAESVTIAKYRKNTILSCSISNGILSYQQQKYNGKKLVSEKKLSKSKIRRIRKSFTRKYNNLKKLRKKFKDNERKIGKIEDRFDLARQLLSNLKECRRLDQETGSDLELPENADFDLESKLEGNFGGDCKLYGQNVDAYSGVTFSPILAPLSGSLKCTLDKPVNKEFSVTIVSLEDDSELIARMIKLDDLKDQRIFHLTLCSDFPGCATASKTIEALSGLGIEVQINFIDGAVASSSNLRKNNTGVLSKAIFKLQ